jgi:hypothetical protein
MHRIGNASQRAPLRYQHANRQHDPQSPTLDAIIAAHDSSARI